MKLPISKEYYLFNRKGEAYRAEVLIEVSVDFALYPEGIKATFRMFKMLAESKKRLVLLIDNHFPFGYHCHDQLPSNHNSRKILHVSHWKEAWVVFQQKCQEKLHEA